MYKSLPSVFGPARWNEAAHKTKDSELIRDCSIDQAYNFSNIVTNQLSCI